MSINKVYMPKQTVSSDVIERFLQGYHPQENIVGIEATYGSNEVSLIINDPVLGKQIQKSKFKPFMWVKEEALTTLYGGNRRAIKDAMKRHGIKVKKLNTADADGFIPSRMHEGFKYLVQCEMTNRASANLLTRFFKEGGVDLYGDGKKLAVSLRPEEQYLIQKGKRLFKGMDDYDDLNRFQFDLETTGLDPRRHRIFQIGMKNNKGFEVVLEVFSKTEMDLIAEGREPDSIERKIIERELRESEIKAIKLFFKAISELKPDTITGYNSENFDWDFFFVRCEVLYINIEAIAKTLNKEISIKRKRSTLKLGQETEYFEQTHMWGYTVLDIIHSVRRAQAINSNIKKAGLKYITKFSKIAKPNRVYVDGDKLYTTWASQSKFYLDDSNGDWFEYDPTNELHVDKVTSEASPYKEVKGNYIVQRYLLDDLWETEQVDKIYNQASFLLAKILPTSFMRSSTMGTAGTWKLIMSAWSYEQGLAIPDYEEKRPFVGGLSRLIKVGYAQNVVKFDFAALYPKTQLTYGIFPNLDISGVMEGLLTYVVDTRDQFKFLTGDEEDIVKKLKAKLLQEGLPSDIVAELKADIEKHQKLASDYDKKQLPLKILANSFFGSFGAPYIFNWGEMDSAEKITCISRQNLRMMVSFFHDEYGFEPLVLDTDGVNFAIPKNIDDYTYVCKASHWKTEKYEAGTELRGLEATLARFNEERMIGRMGLDIDDICSSTINFRRKNYANKIGEKVKLVGNSIKSKAMPIYIEEFIDEGVNLLLDGKGYEFIEAYYRHVEDIYNYRIPILKIATKKRVKETLDEYVNVYCRTKNKAGAYKARKAHMELIQKHGLNVDIGDTIYYVNVGNTKSTGDIKTTTDKETKKKNLELMCELIPTDQIEKNPDLLSDKYNVPKYLEAFNKRIQSLLVCFHPDIRNEIMINVEKIKIKGVKAADLPWTLQDRNYFTHEQCAMDSGHPFEESDQDTYEELMTMSDGEIRFWSSISETPLYMSNEEWTALEADWIERMRIERIEGIEYETKKIQELFMRLEVDELEEIKVNGNIPKAILEMVTVNVPNRKFVSAKWDAELCDLNDILKYEDISKERNEFYDKHPQLFTKIKRGKTKYDIWKDEMERIRLEQEANKNARFNPYCTQALCCSEEWDGMCSCFETFEGDVDKLNLYLLKQGLEPVIVKEEEEPTLVQTQLDLFSDEQITKIEQDAKVVQKEIQEEAEKQHHVSLKDIQDMDDVDGDEYDF